MKKFSKLVEKAIIHMLILMMSIILILATIELGYYLVISFIRAEYFLLELDTLLDLFGIFLLVLIGIELLDTIKVYLQEHHVHVEVVVLVAIIAIARKIIIIKIEELSGLTIIGIGVLIIALAIAYYLIKKAGVMFYNFDDDEE